MLIHIPGRPLLEDQLRRGIVEGRNVVIAAKALEPSGRSFESAESPSQSNFPGFAPDDYAGDGQLPTVGIAQPLEERLVDGDGSGDGHRFRRFIGFEKDAGEIDAGNNTGLGWRRRRWRWRWWRRKRMILFDRRFRNERRRANCGHLWFKCNVQPFYLHTKSHHILCRMRSLSWAHALLTNNHSLISPFASI